MTELSTTPAQNRLVTSITKILLGCVLLCVAVGYSVQTYAQQPRDLPPFDQEKAKTLSPEKRTEYDRLLFNELTYRARGSRRHTIDTREAEWLAMAADGHELSYLTLTTVTAGSGYAPHEPEKAYARLEELIQAGDAGAMCLYYWAVLNWQDPYYEQAKVYLQRGSDLGHPECQRQFAILLTPNVDKDLKGNLPTNDQKAFQLLIASASKGYGAPHYLYLYFKDRGLSEAANVERAYCWATVFYDNFEQDGRNDRFRTEAMFLEGVREYAETHNRPDLTKLSEQLATTRPTLQQCLALGDH